jgi:hypothetical protein
VFTSVPLQAAVQAQTQPLWHKLILYIGYFEDGTTNQHQKQLRYVDFNYKKIGS